MVNTQGMNVYLPGAGNLRLIDFSGGATPTSPPDNTNNTNLPNAMTGGTTGANTTNNNTANNNLINQAYQNILNPIDTTNKLLAENNSLLRKINQSQ